MSLRGSTPTIVLLREGLRRSDIAILYRSNAQSRVLEHALFSAGIAYRVYGGLRFFERQEVKHALAYLRVIAHSSDDTAFLRVINLPARGIGARSLEQLSDVARQRNCSLWDAVAHLSGKAALATGTFVGLIEELRAATAGLSLPEMIEHVNRHSGLIAHYESEREGKERIENLNELVNAAAAFNGEEGFLLAQLAQGEPSGAAPPGSAVSPLSPLDAFLAHAALEAGDNQAGEGQDALQLMTVHSAKGLEFEAVFISGLEEGLFPHENSLTEVDGTEEERRLMYVAITRARSRLYLSFSQTRMLHGQTRYNVRSRFFDELPDGALKWLTPRYQAQAAYGARRHGGSSRYSSAWAEPASVPPQAAFEKTRREAQTGFRVGQSVLHAKFGEGVIIKLEGSGSDARAQINFGREGLKTLALGIAKIQVI